MISISPLTRRPLVPLAIDYESRNNWTQKIAPSEVSYTNLALNPMDVRTTIEPRVLRLDRSRDVDTWGYDYDCTTIWAREALLA